ncbi:S-layer homology domain-containing protein [Paenibacillus sp. ClWae2A]|uniref:S-layer homology domain-containing protein n=1 Tax=Paenibacillus sp. ClWae2A TaxID=3057177 RepID=UPI0028F64F06|nr:S-layer homology domain-containing protein [Paenibacillus sp. ClWae2A]MDT9723144.1 S-layer homology domain-containing protein [Paenibacillus sp. ClWae2A]
MDRRLVSRFTAIMMIVSLVMTLWGKTPVVLAAPAAPTVVSKVESIEVSGFEAGAVLKLYTVPGVLKDTSDVQTIAGVYLFEDVVPDDQGYFVTQTVNNEESQNSTFTNASLRTPQVTGGIEQVSVSNVYPGATVTLHNLDGTIFNSTPETQPDNTVLFKNVTSRATYYVEQTINGVVSVSNWVDVSPNIPGKPIAQGKLESIEVSGFTSGAILKLYRVDGTLEATSLSVTDSTYLFESVVPRSDLYYVKQTVNGEESPNSEFVNSILRKPEASADSTSVTVSNVYPGATVTLYKLNGDFVSDTPNVQPDGTVIFESLANRTAYYAQQTINGVTSAISDTVEVSPVYPAQPVAVAGVESIEVRGFTSGANLKLYRVGGTLEATAISVTDSTYLFESVVPRSELYYVIQTVNGEDSPNSEFVNSILRKPEASADSTSVTVSNVYPGATVTMYKLNGDFVSDTPNVQSDGTVIFESLANRTRYYAQQTINGVTSAISDTVEVSPVYPARPVAVAGMESIEVSGVTPGAILKLYLVGGTLKATSDPVVGSTYVFENVVPDSREYYVTQTVNGEQSENSDFVGVNLRKPEGSVGIGYLDVGQVYEGATVTLYLTNGTFVSSTPLPQLDGTLRFADLPAGGEYYVVQSINGVISEATPWLMIPSVPYAPTNVKATAGNGQATITFNVPGKDGGSVITGYEVTSTPGNIKVTGNSSPITVTGLTNGISYTFTLKAINAVGSSVVSVPSNAVTPSVPSSGDSSGNWGSSVGSSSPQPVSADGINVLINGVSEQIGNLIKTTRNGQLVSTVGIDSEKLKQKLAAEGTGAVVSIRVPSGADVLIGELDGQMVQEMQAAQAVLKLETEQATYTLPLNQIQLFSLAKDLGDVSGLQDMKVQVEIAKLTQAATQAVRRATQQNNFVVQGTPVDFTVRGLYEDNSVEITQFTDYVERTMILEEGVSNSGITTGVVVNADGTVRHVPTRVVLREGRYEAVINSLSNSTYALILHPLKFGDVVGHWAQDAVDDMGSRMIIEGTGNGSFSPDQNITRAEFAAIVTRALGVAPRASNSGFTDVSSDMWYSAAIGTARDYNLINGYTNGTFQPNEEITREEAILMLARAMDLTSLSSPISDQKAEGILRSYASGASVSSWAIKGVAQSIQAGIVSGRTSGDLASGEFITRAEVTQMISRLLKKSGLI